jgi:hypothetical protein
VSCRWDGSFLILQADNDFDSNGLALIDEFSDAISACIKDPGDGDINLVSVTVLGDESANQIQVISPLTGQLSG